MHTEAETPQYWVLVQEFHVSYHYKETILFSINPFMVTSIKSLNKNPENSLRSIAEGLEHRLLLRFLGSGSSYRGTSAFRV